MAKGDIVLIPFPFTDLSGNKLRPALVLVENKFDIIVSFITTQTYNKDAWDISLPSTTGNGLKKNSLLKLSKIATLDRTLSIGKIGSIDEHLQKAINGNLIELLQLH
jgi:mRNA interferase MazF